MVMKTRVELLGKFYYDESLKILQRLGKPPLNRDKSTEVIRIISNWVKERNGICHTPGYLKRDINIRAFADTTRYVTLLLDEMSSLFKGEMPEFKSMY